MKKNTQEPTPAPPPKDKQTLALEAVDAAIRAATDAEIGIYVLLDYGRGKPVQTRTNLGSAVYGLGVLELLKADMLREAMKEGWEDKS